MEPVEDVPERPYRSPSLVKAMAQNKELVVALALAVLAFLNNLGQSAVVSKEDAVYYNHQHARRFFAATSKVRDLYAGQMTTLQQFLFDDTRLFVMYYAPWSADSMRARNEFHKAAAILHTKVPFIAVNCWWPTGECSQKFKFAQYPSFYMYFLGVGNGFFYSGPATAEHFVLFIEKLLFPLRPLTSLQAVDDFNAQADSALIGYFNQSSLMSRRFLQFYYASMRAVEKDFLQPVKFGVVLNAHVASYLRLNLSSGLMLLRSLNDSLPYPEGANFTSSSIVEWAYANRQPPVVTWYIPPLRKSRQLHDVLSKGPTLIVLAPHDPLGDLNHHFEQLRELALEYSDCGLPPGVSSRLDTLLTRSAWLRSEALAEQQRRSAATDRDDDGGCSETVSPDVPPAVRTTKDSQRCCFSLNSSLVWAAPAAAAASALWTDIDLAVGTVTELCVSAVSAGSSGSNSMLSFCRLPSFQLHEPWLGHSICPSCELADACVLRHGSIGLLDSGLSWTIRPCQPPLPSPATGGLFTPAACAPAHCADCAGSGGRLTSALYGSGPAQPQLPTLTSSRRRPTDAFVVHGRMEAGSYACDRKALRSSQGYSALQSEPEAGTGIHRTQSWPPPPHSTRLRDAACRTNKTLDFLLFDSKLYPAFAQRLLTRGLPLEATAAAAILVDTADEAVYELTENATKASLAGFLLRYLAGDVSRVSRALPAQRKSRQPLPAQPVVPKAPTGGMVHLPDVTSDLFQQLVLDDSKDVLVLYHSPFCGFCKLISHRLLVLARYFREAQGFAIMRLDVNANDLPWQFAVSRVPSLILYPAHRKSDSVQYDLAGGLDVVDLAGFVLAYSSHSMRIHDGISLAACSRSCLLTKWLHNARLLSVASQRMQRLSAAVSSLATAVANGTVLERAAAVANTTWAFQPRLRQLEWHFAANLAELKLRRLQVLNLKKLDRILKHAQGSRRTLGWRHRLSELLRQRSSAAANAAAS